MRLFAYIVLTLGLLTLAAAAGPHIALDASTRTFLEGSWSDDCAGWPSYHVEFQNSGGSVVASNHVDFSQRGWIQEAHRRGRDVYLTVDFSGGAVWKLHFELGADAAIRDLSGHFDHRGPLRKCHPFEPRPGAKLPQSLVRRFTNATFIPAGGGRDDCERFDPGRDYNIGLDLAGASAFPTWRYTYSFWQTQPAADPDTTVWRIVDVARQGDGLRVTLLHDGTEREPARRQTLTMIWIDATHLRVVEWGGIFLRCPKVPEH